MKILTIEEREDSNIVVTTQSDGEFVYPSDKFNNLNALEREINKKLLEVERKTTKKEAKIQKIKDELKKVK